VQARRACTQARSSATKQRARPIVGRFIVADCPPVFAKPGKSRLIHRFIPRTPGLFPRMSVSDSPRQALPVKETGPEAVKFRIELIIQGREPSLP
jgi:hypothetical protein